MDEMVKGKIQQGVELIAFGKYQAAKALFTEVIAHDNKSYDAYIHLGNACVNLEQYDEAISSFKKAQILRPNEFEVLYSLGCAHFLNGENVEALRMFNQCEKNGDATVEMYGLMEMIFIDADDLVQAIRCANRAIQLNPLDAEPYVDKAQLYVMQNKSKEAISCLREVEELLPDSGEPYMIEAQILLQMEEPEQALSAVNRAIERFPEDVSMKLLKCRILNDLARYQDALKLLELTKQAVGDDRLHQRDIAMIESVARLGLKDLDGSIESLESAVKDDSYDADVLYLLANECFAHKEYEKTMRYCEKMLGIPDVQPRYRAAAIFWDASARKELGDEEGAKEAFGKAVTSLRQINIGDAGLVEVYVYRALANAELGQFDDALELIDHVIQLMPEEAPGYAFKAQILGMKGDLEGANGMRSKALELDPDFEF